MPTQQMRVDNTAFLIEKLAADCAPLQFVRELTSNAIEAIEARLRGGWDGEGRIIWDADWSLVESKGLYKLQIADNGTGMTGPEIEKYINQLSSSGRIQDQAKNFGLGAKITACVNSPRGLVYKSWVDSAGVLADLWKDPDAGYGLRQYEFPNDEFAHYAPLNDDAKPDPIDACGTAVVLVGKHEDEHTFMPEGMKNKWLIKYLNDRYYDIPSGIKIHVRNFQRTDPEGWPSTRDSQMGDERGGSQLREIKGMKANLEKHATDNGAVDLGDATAHWWLLPEDEIKQKDIWESSGHSAALFQNELYDFARGNNGRSRLRTFGVVFGLHRVVLYVEPHGGDREVYANTPRSNLLVGGEPLPWDEWAAKFRSKLPAPIEAMMDDLASRSSGENHRDFIKRQLKELGSLLKITRYRRRSGGPSPVGGQLPGGDPGEGSPITGSRNRGGKSGGVRGDLYGAFIKLDGGDDGEAVTRDSREPRCVWISVEDRTREPEDLEDRAARFILEENMIQLNADFRGFHDLIRHCEDQYNSDGAESQTKQIREVVEMWIEFQLTEVVLHVLALQGSPEWGSDQIKSALSEEAMTAAALPKMLMLKTINRALGARLGSLSKAE